MTLFKGKTLELYIKLVELYIKLVELYLTCVELYLKSPELYLKSPELYLKSPGVQLELLPRSWDPTDGYQLGISQSCDYLCELALRNDMLVSERI